MILPKNDRGQSVPGIRILLLAFVLLAGIVVLWTYAIIHKPPLRLIYWLYRGEVL